MHRPKRELARDPLMKEFVDARRGQAIASSPRQRRLDRAMGAPK
jgi:hypothetical protein